MKFLEIVLTVLVVAKFVGAQRQVCFQVCASRENRLIVCCPWVPGQETRLQARYQANTPTPREGDNCTMVDTGKMGVCSQFGNCPTAMEAASKGKFPQVCAVEGLDHIVCCLLVTVAEGDQCTLAATGRVGKCLRITKCPVAMEAALKGVTPQICSLDDSVPVVCCEGVVEGDNCTMVDTGRVGVCSRFANCQTAMEASSKGISPQICALEDRVQIVCCPPVTVIEGDNCTMVDTGRAGVCRPFAKCQAAKEAANRGIFQQRCDLTDNESKLVCCTKTDCPPLPKGLFTQLPIGSKAADYCIELAEKIHPCQETSSGWTRGNMCPLLTPDSNIVYHHTPMTTTAEAPYYGRIGSGQRGDINWPGSPVILVSDQWALCGAWAINYIGSSNVQFVGLGGTFTPRYNPDEIYGVRTQHIHPLYNQAYYGVINDIALLQLDREVKFTSRILPVCLHTGTPLPDSGFILTEHEEGKTSMQRLSQEECSRVFPTGSNGHPAGIKHDVEICSRPVNPTEECAGWYSGSPLILPNSHRVACTHLLVGFVSNWMRPSCTFTNTRISGFIPWIEGIVWPESSVVV